jgi:hypothetical protein
MAIHGNSNRCILCQSVVGPASLAVLHKFSLCLQSFQQLRQTALPNGISISEIPLLTDIVEFEDKEESK